MKKKLLASVTALAAGAGLAFGQGPPAPQSPDPAAVSATSTPIVDPNLMRVIGSKERLYLQGGPPGGPPPDEGCGHCHQLFPRHSGDGCNPGSCGEGGCGPGCGDGGCGHGGGHGCGNGSQIHNRAGGPDCFYFEVESLFFILQPMAYSAPILTSGPIGSTGRIGEDGVGVLVGENDLRYGPMPALRLNMGFWGEDRCWGFGGNAWLTEQRAEVNNFSGPSTGRTVIARPNINVLTGVPDSILVASPPNFGGTASVYTNARAGGAEFNLLKNWAYFDKFKVTGLAGMRWMSLNEQLRVDTQAVVPGIDPLDPAITDINDTFTTRNNFYGGQLGIDVEIRHGRWFSHITAKGAAGFVHEKLNQSGFTRVTQGGIQTLTPYGALVLEPNSGDFSDKEFAYLPEANVHLGYQWTQRLSTYIGYDYMYLSEVVRPGDQLNANVNPTLLPVSGVYNQQFPFGPAEPSLRFTRGDFFLHGIQLGLSYRY